MGYVYNDIYSSVISYFDAEVFSSDIFIPEREASE